MPKFNYGSDDSEFRFNMKRRITSKLVSELGIRTDVLERLEEWALANGIGEEAQEAIEEAAQEGDEFAQKLLNELLRCRATAAQGLMVQQSLETLGRRQAELEYSQKDIQRTQAILDRNKELEAKLSEMAFSISKKQVKRLTPYLLVSILFLTASVIFLTYGNNSSPTVGQSSVQQESSQANSAK